MTTRKGRTFIVEIKQQQNATWQGMLNILSLNKKVPFRSALELIKIIDSVIEEPEIKGQQPEKLTGMHKEESKLDNNEDLIQ